MAFFECKRAVFVLNHGGKGVADHQQQACKKKTDKCQHNHIPAKSPASRALTSELQRPLHIQRARLACIDAFVVVVIRADEVVPVEDVFHRMPVQICHLRAKVIRHACAPEHEAGNAAGTAVGALFHRIGVIRKLAGLEIAVQIERPVSGL